MSLRRTGDPITPDYDHERFPTVCERESAAAFPHTQFLSDKDLFGFLVYIVVLGYIASLPYTRLPPPYSPPNNHVQAVCSQVFKDTLEAMVFTKTGLDKGACISFLTSVMS